MPTLNCLATAIRCKPALTKHTQKFLASFFVDRAGEGLCDALCYHQLRSSRDSQCLVEAQMERRKLKRQNQT